MLTVATVAFAIVAAPSIASAESSTASARGHGGHYIVCIPQHDLVVVHRVNTDIEGREVTRDQFGKLLKMILDAKQ